MRHHRNPTAYYIIAIIFILVVAFLSQQPYFVGKGQNIVSDVQNQAQAQMAKASEWINESVFKKTVNSVQSGGETIQNQATEKIIEEKNKISDNVGKKVETYFSGVKNSVLNQPNNNCQSVEPIQTSSFLKP